MKSSLVRQKYFDFFKSNGHKLIPSGSLIPDDKTTLFTSAGMQPMIPYLLGEIHPEGKRIVNSQKCFRSQDILEVGDNRHTTFFEMLGNWSFGDYFKKEQLNFIFEFLTKELNLNPHKLYVTVFEGKGSIPKDEETIKIWQEIFASVGIEAKLSERIFTYDSSKNWWTRAASMEDMPEGEPGGPDSEVFYEFSDIEHNPKYGKTCHPNCDCGRFLEIANSVFMQFQKKGDSFVELPQKNVDFGGGLERLTAATENQPDVFKIDLFWPLIEKLTAELNTELEYGSDEKATASLRVIADHMKAAVFLIKDGVIPSNKMQGYVLRRLLRRAAVKIHILKENSMGVLPKLVDPILDIYQETEYFQVGDWDNIRVVIEDELNKFKQTLKNGLKEFDKFINTTTHGQSTNKVKMLSPKDIFRLYETFGFPYEVSKEEGERRGIQMPTKEEFEEELRFHQKKSRLSSKL